MISRNDLTQYAADAAVNPKIVAPVATATAGAGLNEIFGWVETGVGFAAACLGLMVTFAIWRRNRLEHREVELRIKVLESQLQDKS